MNAMLVRNPRLTQVAIASHRPWLRALFVLLLSLVLGSCSTVRLGYSNADTLIYWWADGYVDFRSAQKTKVKKDIAQLLSWHRATQLPQYLQTLTQMQAALNTNPGQADIETIFKQVEHFSQVLLVKAVPELTDVILSMDDTQKAHLARKFDKNNEEFRDKYLNRAPDKQFKERLKKITKQTDEWLGSINREQETIISRYLEKHPANYAQWLDESVARQRMVLRLITQIHTEKLGREAAQAVLQKTIIAAYEPADPNARVSMQQLIVDILRVATPEQKNHARNKLQDWIDDCKYLISKS